PKAPLVLVVNDADRDRFSINPEEFKRVCVTGVITMHNGKPRMVLKEQGLMKPYQKNDNNRYSRIESNDTDDSIYTNVEENPSFNGGNIEFFKFIHKNLIYPQKAKEAGIQGNVSLNF